MRKMEEELWFPEAVGGLMIGAEPIAFAIARESINREVPIPIGAFACPEGTKTAWHAKDRGGSLETTEGRKVVILDDVCIEGRIDCAGYPKCSIRQGQ